MKDFKSELKSKQKEHAAQEREYKRQLSTTKDIATAKQQVKALEDQHKEQLAQKESEFEQALMQHKMHEEEQFVRAGTPLFSFLLLSLLPSDKALVWLASR